MPTVTFTLKRGHSRADKAAMSEALMEALVAAGYPSSDQFHRFIELDPGDFLVHPHFPDYAEPRTERFVMVEVIISRGKPPQTAPTIAQVATDLFEKRLGLVPPDIMFIFHEVNPDLPRYPPAPAKREVVGT